MLMPLAYVSGRQEANTKETDDMIYDSVNTIPFTNIARKNKL